MGTDLHGVGVCVALMTLGPWEFRTSVPYLLRSIVIQVLINLINLISTLDRSLFLQLRQGRRQQGKDKKKKASQTFANGEQVL